MKATRHRCDLALSPPDACDEELTAFVVRRHWNYVPYTLRCRVSGNVATTLNHGCSTTTISWSLTKSMYSMLLYRKHMVQVVWFASSKSLPSPFSPVWCSCSGMALERFRFFPRTCVSGKMRHCRGKSTSVFIATMAPKDP